MTANQLTLARLILLPLPVVMVYQGQASTGDARAVWLLSALAVFVVLGLTDALDGILARKYGGTPVGAFLDPLADKIFLVATFVLLADLNVVWLGLVVVLFVRELAVTALRSIALEESFSFRTSRTAKLKTTVQMAGAGFILLIWLFPRGAVIGPILAVAVAASLVPSVVAILRRRLPGWKAISAAVLIGAIGICRTFLDPLTEIHVMMIVITGLTVVSGLRYAWGMRSVLARRFRASPVEAIRLAGLSLAVPIGFLLALSRPSVSAIGVMALLGAELAAGGLDNSLVQAGRRRGPAADLLRIAAQAVAAGLMLVGLRQGLPALGLWMPWLATAVTVVDFGWRLGANLDAFAPPSASEPTRSSSPPASVGPR